MARFKDQKRLIAMLMLMTSFLFLFAACGDAAGSGGYESVGLCEPGEERCLHLTPDPGAGDRNGDRGGPGSGPGPTPDPRVEINRTHDIWPQVWSQHAPGVKSWEYKVNCGQARSHTEPCFLSDLTAVNVEAPDGSLTELDFDFNTNEYSGEITRRWVKYGPEDGNLPAPGDYVFRYWRGDELALEQPVPYASETISFPKDVTWRRDGAGLLVDWAPPPEAAPSMHYKAIIWEVEDTPPVLVSKQFEWDAASGVLEDVPLLEGGKYSLNVALYFADGYAYSDYVIFEWPATGG